MIRLPFAALPILLLAVPAAAQVTDVPGGHWAEKAARQMVSLGIMKAPGGKFKGSGKVTQRELVTTLAAYARVLEKGWPADAGKPVGKAHRDGKLTNTGAITRYELAAVLSRAAAYSRPGVPRDRSNVFGKSEAFPPAPKVTLPPSDPAYEAVRYLAARRMIPSNSALLKPSARPVLPLQLASAVSWVLVGLNDRYTDEPQNREEIAPPPHRHKP